VYIKKPREHGVADQISWREKSQWQLHRKRVEQNGVSVLKKINPSTPRHKCLGLLRVDPERRFIHRPEGWSVRLNSSRSLGAVEWVKVEGKVDEGREVIVRYETGTLKWIKWEGFKSLMVL
jgi:hypothetical protein